MPRTKRPADFSSPPPASKKSKGTVAVSTDAQTDDNGDTYWELSKNRRVGISEFKGTPLVNIREFYEKDGKSLPGKKGISLTIDQFKALINTLPALTAGLEEKGEDIPRPQYSGTSTKPKTAKKEKEDQEDEDDEEEDEEVEKQPKASKKSKLKKSNIEATSDEDEE